MRQMMITSRLGFYSTFLEALVFGVAVFFAGRDVIDLCKYKNYVIGSWACVFPRVIPYDEIRLYF